MRSVVLCSLFCMVGVSVVAVVPVDADPLPFAKPSKSEARSLLTQGNRLYRVRSFTEAIEKFKAGVLAEEAPVFDFNLGQCYRQLGQYKEAIWHYERFVSRGNPDAERLAEVQGFIAQMRAELDRKAMSQPPTDAADTSERVSPPARLPSSASSPMNATNAPPMETRERDGRSAWLWAGWGLTAAGVVGGGATTWFAVTAHGLESDATENNRPTSERLDLKNRADSRRRIALGLGIGSGVALVVGLVTLVVAPATHRSRATAWNVGITGHGMAVFGSF